MVGRWLCVWTPKNNRVESLKTPNISRWPNDARVCSLSQVLETTSIPAKILFEFEGVHRDTPPRRETGQAVAAITANGVGTCGADDNQGQAGHLIAGTLQASGKAAGSATQQDAESGLLVPVQSVYGDIAHTLASEG